jgi:hypothetical protein
MMAQKPTQAEIDFLRSIGRCASVSPDYMGSFMCTRTANHTGQKHKAQVLGGADDGKTLAEWNW